MEFKYDNRILKPGYTSCLGCGEALAMRLVALVGQEMYEDLIANH